MSEEKAAYEAPLPATAVKAVRLENFVNPDWQGFLYQRLQLRYPGARLTLTRPYVVIVDLRSGDAWSEEDEAFFSRMKQEGFFQRWETLSELPEVGRHDRPTYADSGYRVGANERLTTAQSAALLSDFHAATERLMVAERDARKWRERAEQAEQFSAETATIYNEIVEALAQSLQIKVYHQGEAWIAEDAESGHRLLRDVALPLLYKKALRLRLEGKS